MIFLAASRPRRSSPNPPPLRRRGIAAALAAAIVAASAAADERDEEIERLRQLVASLEARVEALEKANAANGPEEGPGQGAAATPPSRQPEPPSPQPSAAAAAPPAEPEPAAEDATASAPAGLELLEETRALIQAQKAQEPPIAFGGALRFTTFVSEANDDAKRGDSGLDLFRVEADGKAGNFLLSAEYRFFPFMETIHHGWIGYEFPEAGQIQVGISQVPFGILPFASHNFWFGVPYYIGLADDYDMGAKYLRSFGDWDFQAAFYKNGELGNAANLERYSFDLVRVGPEHANEETNQLNLRLARSLGPSADNTHELGVSAQVGQVHNAVTGENGSQWALAAHLDSRVRRWNFQLQLARYEYHPENPPGLSDETVRLGAFATSYDIAAQGTLGVANVAYNLPVQLPLVDQILLYNDFSILWKDPDGFDESILNTTGAAIGMGPIFIYLDLIQAQNMVFFGEGSLAGDGETDWKRRLNLNIGYYW